MQGEIKLFGSVSAALALCSKGIIIWREGSKSVSLQSTPGFYVKPMIFDEEVAVSSDDNLPCSLLMSLSNSACRAL